MEEIVRKGRFSIKWEKLVKNNKCKSPPITKVIAASRLDIYEWKHVCGESNVVLENKKIDVSIKRYWIIDNDGNKLYDTISIVEPSSSCVVIIKHDEKIGLIYEWRPIPEKWFWALPRGFGSAGDEDSIDTAVREVTEEVGEFKLAKATIIGDIHQNTSFYEKTTQTVLVDVDRFKEFNLQSEEGIVNFKLFSKKQIIEMIKNGDITCQFTLSSLMIYFSCYS